MSASHNPFGALIEDEDECDEVQERTTVTASTKRKSMSTANNMDRSTPMDESATPSTSTSLRRAQKKAAKMHKRQKREELFAALDSHTDLVQQVARKETTEEKKDQDEENEEDEEDEDDPDTSLYDENDGDDSSVQTGTDSETPHSQSGSGPATNPADVNLTASDIATSTRTLQLLDTHPSLLEHSSLRQLRKVLAPLVQRLSVKWMGLSSSRFMRRALKRSAKESLGTKQSQAMEYELAMDAAARNATSIRATRLKKLESLNGIIDADATIEAHRARLLRVPDGVAITDGLSDDVCMKLLTDSSAKVNGRQHLLTNGSHDAASNTQPASSSAPPPTAKLNQAIKCYICKTPFKELHHFYDSLCPPCAKLNYAKRELTADMTGKIVLLTGARVKIGYRILVKLLRCGATVIATTRFPHDLSVRLRLEVDFHTWSSNVHIYGLDFRNLTVLEQFVAMLYSKYTHLDAIINNACQTVRRPPAYYTHLMDAERIAFEDLSADAQKLLKAHHDFSAAHSGQLQLQANQGMRRLESGGGMDVEVPEIDTSINSSSNSTHRPSTTTSTTFTSSRSSITIVEEDDEMRAADEIIAKAAATKGATLSTPAVAAAAAVSLPPISSTTTTEDTAMNDAPPPKSNPKYSRAASEPTIAASTSAAASATSHALPANSRKRSRRGAMRAAEQQASQQQLMLVGAAGVNGQYTSASALAAESTQLSVLPSDHMSPEERARYFPVGERDVNGQQLDLRTKNSWTAKLEDVPIGEAAEVMAINALAPFLLNSKLKALMCKGNEQKLIPRFIVNVSAMEGKFYRFKSANHPHTNAAKAALNMMTRTSAQDYVNSMIFMTAVDTGWINDENPLPKAAQIAAKFNFQTPLDEIDAAARVLDPIITPLHQLQTTKPKSFKEFTKTIPWGYFIKDYQKSEW